MFLVIFVIIIIKITTITIIIIIASIMIIRIITMPSLLTFQFGTNLSTSHPHRCYHPFSPAPQSSMYLQMCYDWFSSLSSTTCLSVK